MWNIYHNSKILLLISLYLSSYCNELIGRCLNWIVPGEEYPLFENGVFPNVLNKNLSRFGIRQSWTTDFDGLMKGLSEYSRRLMRCSGDLGRRCDSAGCKLHGAFKSVASNWRKDYRGRMDAVAENTRKRNESLCKRCILWLMYY